MTDGGEHMQTKFLLPESQSIWCAGVNYETDESLPGPVLKLTGQRLIIRDSLFSNLVNLAAASLIVISCDLVIRNTTFFSNSQV